MLAWTRTSFAVLANGALLILRHMHGAQGPVRLLPTGLAAVIALGAYVIALQRERTLTRRPLPQHITARPQVYLIGTAVLLLIVVTMIALPL